MKILLCGGRQSLAYEVSVIKNGLNVPFVITADAGGELDGLMANTPTQYGMLVKMVTSVNYLSACIKQAEMFRDSMLIAYDMPIFNGVSDEQPYLPMEMGFMERNQMSLGISSDIARGIYGGVKFDYVFRFPEAPPLEALIENNIVDNSNGVIDVNSCDAVLQVLHAEGM